MRWIMPLIIALSLVVMACDFDDDSDTAIEPADTPESAASTPGETGSAVTPDTGTTDGTPAASDGEMSADDFPVDMIRQLIGAVSEIDPRMVNDVQFEDGTLTVTLEDESAVGSADVDSVCSDLNNALGFTDLEVVIESGGSQLARCSFTS